MCVCFIAQSVAEYADCKRVSLSRQPMSECPAFDGEAPVQGFWGMWTTTLLTLLPGLLRLGIVVLVRVSCMGQIDIFNHFPYLKPFNSVQTNDC